ncbi:MAG: SH3 domain-containing protein [Caldilineaceae bacterium]|nr:SH3 domain-containing protein [Caldilineaceae bacterium]
MRRIAPVLSKRLLLLIFTLFASVNAPPERFAFAQDDSCTPVISELNSAIASCDILDSNSACYGNAPAVAIPADVEFSVPGEQQPVTAFTAIDTDPLAGAVLMLLNIRREESLLTVILFGDSTLIPEDPASSEFTFQGGEGSELCPQTPPGMVVSTAAGRHGRLTVNGVQVDLRSAAYIVMTGENSMVIANLGGQVTVTIDGQSQELPLGYQTQILQIGLGQPVFAGPPSPSPLYGSAVARWLVDNPDGLRRVTASDATSGAACGGTIAFGETITAQLSPSSDECLYTFCSLEGRAVNIQLEGVTGSEDPWVALRGPGGTLLKFNNDISEQNLNSRICNATLPVVGCYTIVARSTNDDDTGVFRLSLNQQTTCTQPVPRCEVTVNGLNQREGPSLDSPIIRTLPQGTQLRPVESSADGQWARMQVAGTILEGWVSTSSQFLACADEIPGPLITPTPPPATTEPEVDPTDTPTPTPIPTPSITPKPGPFGGP